MRELELVACWEITPEDKLEQYQKDPDLFMFYCSDSDLTYILRVNERIIQSSLKGSE